MCTSSGIDYPCTGIVRIVCIVPNRREGTPKLLATLTGVIGGLGTGGGLALRLVTTAGALARNMTNHTARVAPDPATPSSLTLPRVCSPGVVRRRGVVGESCLPGPEDSAQLAVVGRVGGGHRVFVRRVANGVTGEGRVEQVIRKRLCQSHAFRVEPVNVIDEFSDVALVYLDIADLLQNGASLKVIFDITRQFLFDLDE